MLVKVIKGSVDKVSSCNGMKCLIFNGLVNTKSRTFRGMKILSHGHVSHADVVQNLHVGLYDSFSV